MTQEHIAEPPSVGAHLEALSRRLSAVPELQPVIDIIAADRKHAIDVYNSYVNLAEQLANLDEVSYETIRIAQAHMQGESGSASVVNAIDLSAELSDRNINLVSVVQASIDQNSPYYQPAMDQLASRMRGGHAMKIAGKTPSDHDADSLEVIWGHTVITGHEALLHFVAMHYIERFVSQSLLGQEVPVAQQKDFFINSMTDVVILNGLKDPDDPIFRLWFTPKDQGGMGWITQDRLSSYMD